VLSNLIVDTQSKETYRKVYYSLLFYREKNFDNLFNNDFMDAFKLKFNNFKAYFSTALVPAAVPPVGIVPWVDLQVEQDLLFKTLLQDALDFVINNKRYSAWINQSIINVLINNNMIYKDLSIVPTVIPAVAIVVPDPDPVVLEDVSLNLNQDTLTPALI
jgi:hypothetical protein